MFVAACAGTPAAAPSASVARGYILAEVEVTNPEPYKEYLAVVTPMVARFGGAYIVRGGKTTTPEGAAPKGRMVVIEFPSFEAAEAFYNAPAYQAVIAKRTANANSRLIIAEGTSP
jgi:uncharacterized protein (DUF1330 family)